MFVIKKLRINNFMSVQHIDLEFQGTGLTLIQGIVEDANSSSSNGVGKSSIADAILYCLYDQTLRGINKDDVVNRFYGKDCYVTVLGELDGVEVRITRHRKHTIEENKICLFYNNKEVTGSSDRETNFKIIDLLKMDFSDMQTNIVFSNTSTKFLELGDTDRKKLFDSIVKSDIYEKCLDKTRENIVYIERNIEKLEIEKKVREEARIKTINSIRETEILRDEWKVKVEKHLETLTDELGRKLTEKRDYKLSMPNGVLYEESSQELKVQEQDLLKKFAVLNGTNIILDKSSTTKFLELTTKITSIRKDISSVESAVASEDVKLGNFLKLEEDLVLKINTYDNSISDNKCPTCGQLLVDIEHVAKERYKLQDTLREYQDGIKKSRDTVKKAEKELKLKNKTLAETLVLLEDVEKSYNVGLLRYEEDTKALAQDISTVSELLKSITAFRNKHNMFDSQIENIKTQILSKEKEENPFINLMANKILSLKEEQEKLDSLVGLISMELRKLESYKFWIKGFKDIKGLMIETITPLMNEKATEYANILTNGEFSINFVTQRLKKDGEMKEVFEIEVERFSGANNYKSLSAGEKRRVDIVIMFVLDYIKQLSMMSDVNLRFYDELYDSLDDVGVECMMALLSHVSTDKKVFVLSHNSDFKDLFPEVLTLSKRNGITSLFIENSA